MTDRFHRHCNRILRSVAQKSRNAQDERERRVSLSSVCRQGALPLLARRDRADWHLIGSAQLPRLPSRRTSPAWRDSAALTAYLHTTTMPFESITLNDGNKVQSLPLLRHASSSCDHRYQPLPLGPVQHSTAVMQRTTSHGL